MFEMCIRDSMNGVILYGKLDANSAEAAFQFRVDFFEILGWDIS